MDIVVSQEQGRVPITVFRITGDIAGDTYRPFEDQAKAAIADGTRYLLLDLSNVSYISSAGMRALHSIYVTLPKDEASAGDAKQRNVGLRSGTYKSAHLKLYKPSKRVSQALSLAGYDMFLEMYDDYDAAIAAF